VIDKSALNILKGSLIKMFPRWLPAKLSFWGQCEVQDDR